MLDYGRKAWRAARRGGWRATELAMDRAWGIVTTSWSQERAEWQAEVNGYEPIPYRALPVLDANLAVTPDEVVYDIGCGKGRIICHYARKPVARVVGVDYEPGLTQAAEANLATLRGARAPVTIICGDAVDQEYRDASLVILYNPFGEKLMARFIERLLETRGKALRIVYLNPTQAALFERNPLLTPAGEFRIPYDLSSCRVRLWTVPAPN